MPIDPKRPTARELDIARLIAVGFRNQEIATNLGISEGTVRQYLVLLFRKLEIKSRLQLALWAKEDGKLLCFPEG